MPKLCLEFSGLDSRQDNFRMLKKAVQQGRSERRDEAYAVRYVESLSGARTTLADFFSILLELQKIAEKIFPDGG